MKIISWNVGGMKTRYKSSSITNNKKIKLKNKNMNRKQGFTLIEVVLAIAVGLIIVAGVAVGYNYAKRAAIIDNQRKDAALATPSSESETTPTSDQSQTAQKQTVITSVTPASKTEFTVTDVSTAVTLKWNPVTPKTEGTVTYRIKVWQLMQGQNGTQAMKTNQPIITKDVDNVTEVTISGIYTGPCKPPYLCDYIWDVQVISKTDLTTGATGTTGTR
ncbi:MAG: prepilin-type N-terminal cleavage/methylation domain-containing protein [bacterium]|nr:prepilin-type N-terminal cleavage/methylation domain-containing protein [bacterium]